MIVADLIKERIRNQHRNSLLHVEAIWFLSSLGVRWNAVAPSIHMSPSTFYKWRNEDIPFRTREAYDMLIGLMKEAREVIRVERTKAFLSSRSYNLILAQEVYAADLVFRLEAKRPTD